VPHSPQNFRVSGLLEWQVGQLIATQTHLLSTWPQTNRGNVGKSTNDVLARRAVPRGSGKYDADGLSKICVFEI